MLSIYEVAAREAGCVTLVKSAGLDYVLPLFTVLPLEATLVASIAAVRNCFVVPVQTDQGALLWEEGGAQGADAEVLGQLSRGTRAASVFWNVNAVTQIMLAERGAIILSEEASDVRSAAGVSGNNSELFGSEMTGSGLSERIVRMLHSALDFTQMSGKFLDLDEVEVAYPVAPLLHARPTNDASLFSRLADKRFGLGDLNVASLLSQRSMDSASQFVRWAVERAIEQHGLLASPGIAAAFAAYDSGQIGYLGDAATNTVRRLKMNYSLLAATESARVHAERALQAQFAGEALFELCINSDAETRLVSASRRSMTAHPNGRSAWMRGVEEYLMTHT